MASRHMTCRVPRSCVYPPESFRKRVNRVVVFEKTACKPPYQNLKGTGSAFGTPLKVCTGRIRGVCPPGVCDCPIAPCPKEGENTKKFILFSIKLGLVLGIIYETWELGVWSDAEKTAQLSYDYLVWAREFFWTKNAIKRSAEEIYDMRRIKYNFKNVWNNIMFWNNQLAQRVPDRMRELGDRVLPRQSTLVDDSKKKQKQHA